VPIRVDLWLIFYGCSLCDGRGASTFAGSELFGGGSDFAGGGVERSGGGSDRCGGSYFCTGAGRGAGSERGGGSYFLTGGS
jgi:hypothetical protein